MEEMKSYRVPFEAAESEFTEKRSRFIGHIFPAESEQQTQEMIRQIRARYHDARHHCWAYRLYTGGIQRYSDDGEPQGSAGMPILEVLSREEIYNVCCVVTRYFGGILLGTGGLSRAYAKGAKDALAAAGVCTMQSWIPVRLDCSYGLYEQVKRLAAAQDALLTDTEYTEKITLQMLLPQGKEVGLQSQLTELSAGALQLQLQKPVFRPGAREELAP